MKHINKDMWHTSPSICVLYLGGGITSHCELLCTCETWEDVKCTVKARELIAQQLRWGRLISSLVLN